MGFDWEKFWNVGEHLMNYREEEEYQRSAVGRYYYSCYLKAREVYNKKNNFRIDKSISHQQLINKFIESNNEIEKKIGEYLDSLRNSRNNADYDINFNSDLESIKHKSKKVIKYLKMIDKEL